MGDTRIQKTKAATYFLQQNRARSEADSHTTLQILDTSQQEDKRGTLLQVPTVPYIYVLCRRDTKESTCLLRHITTEKLDL